MVLFFSLGGSTQVFITSCSARNYGSLDYMPLDRFRWCKGALCVWANSLLANGQGCLSCKSNQMNESRNYNIYWGGQIHPNIQLCSKYPPIIITKLHKLPLLLQPVLVLWCTAVLRMVWPSGVVVPQQKPLLDCCWYNQYQTLYHLSISIL